MSVWPWVGNTFLISAMVCDDMPWCAIIYVDIYDDVRCCAIMCDDMRRRLWPSHLKILAKKTNSKVRRRIEDHQGGGKVCAQQIIGGDALREQLWRRLSRSFNPCGETPLKAITQRLPPLNPQPELQIQPELRTHKTHLTGIYQSLALSATLLLTIVL